MASNPSTVSEDLQNLVHLMARLRGVDGCPWDREQTWRSLLPFTIEEAYEVVEAVETGQADHLRDELGDLLFHIVFYSRIAEESGQFNLADVIQGVIKKMTRRHPHVFDPQAERMGHAALVPGRWEAIKKTEKARKQRPGEDNPPPSVFDDLNSCLPALLWAAKVQRKMAQVGFDWDNISAVVDKIQEELAELSQAQKWRDQSGIEEEMGDVLFTLVNLARHLNINPEMALRAATLKSQKRFRYMESRLHKEGRTPREATLDELETLWQESKTQEK